MINDAIPYIVKVIDFYNTTGGTYYDDGCYLPNQFIIKDSELTPIRKPKRCPYCNRVELMNRPDYSLKGDLAIGSSKL